MARSTYNAMQQPIDRLINHRPCLSVRFKMWCRYIWRIFLSGMLCAYLVGNAAANNSGRILTPDAALSYLTNSPSPVAKGVLAQLERSTRSILASSARFERPVTGCDLKTYLDDFAEVPEGAAPAMATLATYAHTVDIANGWGDRELAKQALAEAVKIVNVHTRGSFTREGRPINSSKEFCKYLQLQPFQVEGAVALLIGRGMDDWIAGLDLLHGALTNDEEAQARSVVRRIRNIVHESALVHIHGRPDCARYDNQASSEILSLILMSAYLNDREALGELASGTLSLKTEIVNTIYGQHQTAKPCYPGPYNEGYFQTQTTAPGEIVDRFRAKPYQPFGYTLGSLRWMMMSGKVLSNRGFNVLNTTGSDGQNIDLALTFYGRYIVRYLSSEQVSIPATGDLPSLRQYAGQVLTRSGGASIRNSDNLLTPFLLAIHQFPENKESKEVISKAFSFPGYVPFSGTGTLNISDVAYVIGFRDE